MTKERILVIDDEPGVVRSCTRILKRQGYTVQSQTESESVPALLRRETFDLLLTDIKMPRLDGLELLKIARDIDPHLTVVLITGYGTMEDAIRAIGLGAQGFLMKPFEPQELTQTIEDSLARRQMLRDSLHLQTLLPLLEINKTLQVSGGEISLVQRVLQVASQEIGAGRLAWLSRDDAVAAGDLTELATAGPQKDRPSRLPAAGLAQAINSGAPVWVLADGQLVAHSDKHRNIVGALLPLSVKERLIGLLTAEVDDAAATPPFGRLSLELLLLLTGQLAIVIENIQLFQETEALHRFNDDIIRNMTNGLIAIDHTGVITAFNPAAAQITGFDPEKALHQPLKQVLSQMPTLVKAFEETHLTGRGHAQQELEIWQADGDPIPVMFSTAPLDEPINSQPTGQTIGVVGVMEDLSAIKQLEAEHRRLDRLAALGEMSAVVAHEIRNPVAGVSAGIDYLTRNAAAGSAEAQGAAMIQEEIKRVNRILEDILFVARPLQLELVQQPLQPIIKTVLQRYQQKIQSNQVTINTQLAKDLPTILVDEQRLEQVLSNLVVNGLQAMPNGGQLTITAVHQPPANNSNSHVIITVADSGVGISPEMRRKIFDPFFTTKAKGTGLGLSVAHRIIEEHHGSISIDETVEQGSRFIIKLPTQPTA